VFLSGVRTGFGHFGGTLKDLSAIELGAVAAKHALERSSIPPAEVGPQHLRQRLQTSRRRDLLRFQRKVLEAGRGPSRRPQRAQRTTGEPMVVDPCRRRTTGLHQ